MPEIRTAAERLERVRETLEGFQGARAASRAARRQGLSRGQNLLLGAALHAAARLEQGLESTMLEEQLLQMLRAGADDDAEVASWGRLFAEQRTARGGVKVFPSAVNSLDVQRGYGMQDLLADLAELTPEIVAQPNVQVIDITGADPEESTDGEEFLRALDEYGSGVTVLAAPTGAEREARAVTGPPVKLLLKPQRFVCERRSGEVGHDEIYWAMSAGADSGEKKSFKTPEFGSVQTGSDRAFTGGHAGILTDGWVRGHVSLNIECWEADDSSGGFYNKMREVLNTLAERLADGAKSQTYEPPEHGGANPEGWAALLSVVAQLVNALLGWLTNDDDLVCERTIGLDRAALNRYFTASGRAANWLFNGGGGGSHRLWLHGTVTPYEVKPRYRELSSAGSPWGTPGSLADRRGMSLPAVGVSWANNFTKPGILYTDAAADQLFWADSTNDMGGPVYGAHTIVPAAGVEFDGKVYCVFTGRDGRVYWTVRTGTTWSAPADTAWGSRHSPALAVRGNELYCAHTGVGGDIWLATFTGSSWGAPTPLGSWRTASGPALAAHGSPAKLQCAHRGATDTIWVASLNGTTWADPTEISPSTVKTYETPALASFDGQLHVAYRGHNHNLFVITPFGSSSRPTEIQSGGYGAPSLAVHGGKLYAFQA